MTINLKNYQFDFIYAKERHPALVAGWGTGKTLCAISRSLIYSQYIPNNLGIIFRKTFTSLRDSTLQDFERYTGYKVDSNRNYTFPNGSIIMFRHLDELNSINQQNINLGWFYLEQAEELESDKEFWMLWGRLRREVLPDEEFIKYGLATRSGWVIANAGDNWIKQLWKEKKLDNGSLIEATTFDNADNLPKDYIESLEVIKKMKPEIYAQYVMNDWSVNADKNVLITAQLISQLKDVQGIAPEGKKLLACDPSQGGDECVIYIFEDSKIVDERILHLNDTMKIVGEILILMNKHKLEYAAIDTIGIGKGIGDRLAEMGKKVISICSAASASDDKKYTNLRAEMWWYVMERMYNRTLHYPECEVLRRQLSAVHYKVVNSNGKIQLEPKDDTKERLGNSPDRADAYIYGIWALSKIKGLIPTNDFNRAPELIQTRGYGWDRQNSGVNYGWQ